MGVYTVTHKFITFYLFVFIIFRVEKDTEHCKENLPEKIIVNVVFCIRNL